MSALSDLLADAAAKDGISARRRADQINGRLHFGTLAAYQRGDHPQNPDETTLQALADAYRLPLEAIQTAAGVPVGAGPYTPPPEAARLTRRQQAAITELIRSMVDTTADNTVPVSAEPKPLRTAPKLARLSPKQLRLLEQAQPVTQAAYDGSDPTPQP